MKIFFSASVAALLGFVTVASPVSAQDSILKLWDNPRVATRQTDVIGCSPGAAYQAGPGSILETPYQQQPVAPVQSGVPYFYGGDTVSSPVVPQQAPAYRAPGASAQYGYQSSGCASQPAPNAYGQAMRGSWGSSDVYASTSCSKGRKKGMFAGLGKGRRSNACGPQQSQWFGGVNGLAFWRDDAKETFLSFPTGDPRNRVLTSRSVDADPFAGAEVTIGRHLNNGMSLAASYWGLFADSDTAQYANGGPQTYLTGLSQLNYNASDVETYFNNRSAHRVRVRNEFHNLEVNMLRRNCASPLFGGCGPQNRIDLFAGARFFKFDEDFQYAGAQDGANFGADINDMFYDIDVENNLYGMQFGGTAYQSLGKNLALTAGSKVGVYGNHIKQRQAIYGSAGNATINSGSYTGQDYNFSNDKEDVSFLGEIDLGLRYCFNDNMSANLGYRGIFVNGVAHSTDQIPYNYTNVPGIQQIDSNGSLILHGIYMGATYNY